MKKALTHVENRLWHYVGEKVDGKNSKMTGDCSGLTGNCTGLTGDCTDLTGNCTGLRGDCTDLRGNIDDCDLTDEDREKGINIRDLIKEVAK